MIIEEIKDSLNDTKKSEIIRMKDSEKRSIEPLVDTHRFIAYWFPLNKGFNRLLLVLYCLVAIAVAYDYPDKLNTFLLVLGIEIVVYIAIIWIFRGFKELPKDTENEKE